MASADGINTHGIPYRYSESACRTSDHAFVQSRRGAAVVFVWVRGFAYSNLERLCWFSVNSDPLAYIIKLSQSYLVVEWALARKCALLKGNIDDTIMD